MLYIGYPNSVHRFDLNDIYGLYEISAEQTLLPGACGTFTRIYHIVKCEISLYHFQKIEVKP